MYDILVDTDLILVDTVDTDLSAPTNIALRITHLYGPIPHRSSIMSSSRFFTENVCSVSVCATYARVWNWTVSVLF